MWSEFWKNAKVIGIDIDRKRLFTEGNIVSVYGDQKLPLETIVPVAVENDCDVFLDDGSHLWSHQINTFKEVFPVLKSGAVYILEDLHTSLFGSPYNDTDLNPLEFIQQYVKENDLNYKLIDNNERSSISILIEKP